MDIHSVNRTMNERILFLLMLLCLVACKKEGIVDTPVKFVTPFTGITETDSTGPNPIGKIDTSDWKPLMDCPADTSTPFAKRLTGGEYANIPPCTVNYPAYPNPARKSFQVEFVINDQDSVILTLNSSPSVIVEQLLNRRLTAGVYSISVNGLNLQPAIYRVYITVFRQSDVLHSYGDVQIDN
jgi:hypothetical protein